MVGQELTVLPEQDVLVAPVEGQRGMSLLQMGFQAEVDIPKVCENLCFAVVEGQRSMAEDNAPDVDFADEAGRVGAAGVFRCDGGCVCG